MPRPAPPPTPQASLDIQGKKDPHGQADHFTLPPAAFASQNRKSSSISSAPSHASDSSYRPATPPQSSNANKKSSRKRAAPAQDANVTLPPPPTRNRKIIQMKPKGQQQQDQRQQAFVEEENVQTSPSGKGNSKGNGGGGKKKGNGNGQTAAGRKIARKTAHSLIERRRRSKMNEEYNVLKDMIPACTGQDMHKLAILQASIDYIRYLEQCVTELKSQHSFKTTHPSPHPSPHDIPAQEPPSLRDEDIESEEDEDEVMSDASAVSPTTTTAPKSQPFHTLQPSPNIGPHGPPSTTTSPSMQAIDRQNQNQDQNQHQHQHYSPTLLPQQQQQQQQQQQPQSSDPRHYSISSTFSSIASTTSPNILPSPGFSGGLPSINTLTRDSRQFAPLTSPALRPMSSCGENGLGLGHLMSERVLESNRATTGPEMERKDDEEATKALLMLNSDRRCWGGGKRGSASASASASASGSKKPLGVRDLLM